MAAPKPLSKKRRRQLDLMLAHVATYLATPEGDAKLKDLRDLTARIKTRQANLSDRETMALEFIREELGGGHSPSVREITKAISVRSSRTGQKVVRALLLRGLVCRDDNDLLALP